MNPIEYDCWKCREDYIESLEESTERSYARMFRRMIVCTNCGNKRCPKASDHNLKCTNSNKAGQPGSVYQ